MRRAPALLTLALGISACANGTLVADSSDGQTDAQHSSAVLFVERHTSETVGTPAHIGARFVQYSGLSSTSLADLLGTPHIPTGATGCSERADATMDEGARAEARLLDVGPIDVRSGEQSLRLEPRRFPDLWNVVSGVIYATDGELAADEWQFSAAGNPQTRLGAFDVTLRAPDEPNGLVIAEQAFSAGSNVLIPRRAFQVRWNHGDDANDGVMLTIESAPGADHPTTIECAARDEGLLDIDAAWADRMADVARGGASIALHRVRAHAFTGLQVENAQVVFDFSVRGQAQGE